VAETNDGGGPAEDGASRAKRAGDARRSAAATEGTPGPPDLRAAGQAAGIAQCANNRKRRDICFWTRSGQAGFEVERIQMAFPDREALREAAPEKWQREKIEFELFSRNFLEHHTGEGVRHRGPPGAPFFARAGADHCVLGA
jgi:hypothetical protein